MVAYLFPHLNAVQTDVEVMFKTVSKKLKLKNGLLWYQVSIGETLTFTSIGINN